MPTPETAPNVKNFDRRLANIERILPTLATREEMRAEAVETRPTGRSATSTGACCGSRPIVAADPP